MVPASAFCMAFPRMVTINVLSSLHSTCLNLKCPRRSALRTSPLLSQPGRPPQVILVTSALPREGKTTAAANLAVTLAQLGDSTVLVDASSEQMTSRLEHITEQIGDLAATWTATQLGQTIRAKKLQRSNQTSAASSHSRQQRPDRARRACHTRHRSHTPPPRSNTPGCTRGAVQQAGTGAAIGVDLGAAMRRLCLQFLTNSTRRLWGRGDCGDEHAAAARRHVVPARAATMRPFARAGVGLSNNADTRAATSAVLCAPRIPRAVHKGGAASCLSRKMDAALEQPKPLINSNSPVWPEVDYKLDGLNLTKDLGNGPHPVNALSDNRAMLLHPPCVPQQRRPTHQSAPTQSIGCAALCFLQQAVRQHHPGAIPRAAVFLSWAVQASVQARPHHHLETTQQDNDSSLVLEKLNWM